MPINPETGEYYELTEPPIIPEEVIPPEPPTLPAGMRTGVQSNGTPWASNDPDFDPEARSGSFNHITNLDTGESARIPKEPITAGMPKLPNQTKDDRPTIPGPPLNELGGDATRAKFERYAREQIAKTIGSDPITMSVSDFKTRAWNEANRSADEARKTNLIVSPNVAGYNQRVKDFIERKKEGLAQLEYMMQNFDTDHEVGALAADGATYNKETGTIIARNPKEVAPKSKTEIDLREAEQRGDPAAKAILNKIQSNKVAAAEAARAGRGDITERDIVGPVLKALPKKKTEAETADRRIGQYEKLSKMAEAGAGGLVPGLKGILSPIAEALGMDVKTMSEAQAYQLMARAGVGSMRLMLVGSGQVSNYEQDLMQRLSGGSIKTSREAAKLLFDYYATESRLVVSQYNKTVDDLSSDYPEVKKAYGYVGKKGEARPIDSATAMGFLRKAGGDKVKARQLAKDAGYQF